MLDRTDRDDDGTSIPPVELLEALEYIPYFVRVRGPSGGVLFSTRHAAYTEAPLVETEFRGLTIETDVRSAFSIYDSLDYASGDTSAFFSKVAQILALFIDFDYAYVSRFLEDGAAYHIVGAWPDSGEVGREVKAEGAPCEHVIGARRFQWFSGDLGRLFPKAPSLGELGVRTYAGTVYRGPSGLPLGHIFTTSCREVSHAHRLEPVLEEAARAVSQPLLREYLLDELESTRRASNEDPLTGLRNRRAFDRDVERLFAREVTAGQGLLAYVDLDGMKEVNDTRGHLAGDQLLITVSHRLREILRESDSVYRLGGDEFAVLWRIADPEDAPLLKRRVMESIQRVQDDGFPEISASTGVAALAEADDPQALVTRADERMYEEKRGRRRDRR
ncbi:MAG: diguanylate cyclase domain-containing protein [Spirochaetaceae bacterium]